jgi:DNA-binding MarR family transcriptional regulator
MLTMQPQPTSLPSPTALEVHLGYWLRLVSNHVSGEFARALQRRHLSVAEWVALNLIERSQNPTPAVLADAMNMTRGAISKVLDKLAAKDWISRTTSAADSRVQLLSLRRAGSRILPRLAKIADENDLQFFGVLESAERAALERLLRKLADVNRLSNTPVD